MAEKKSTFKGDLKSERAVNEFLQKYLYSYLVDDGIIDSFNSNTTMDQQHKGIDTIMYIINDETEEEARCINIDEKAAIHYARNNLGAEPLSTFAFEVSYLKDGELKRGWLTNEKYKETHAYFLCWLWIKPDANKYNLACEDILKIEVLSIPKVKTRDKLIMRAMGNKEVKTFESKADILRKKMKERGVYRLELEHQLDSLINALDDRPDYNKAHLQFDTDLLVARKYPQWVLTLPEKLYEQPLNIVIKREDLINLANSYWIVTPEGVEVKKSVSKK
ncbi:hypothetical protein OKW85_08180 [Veillonella rogosae]|jgi:hypothetical protein|uniref:Uncharacterized protein n=1 Tax=Veillonella rogosae TaxID=423477 RepID=A0AA47AHG4_9FIRM|nr:hypothetical protein [Veillonella rogosae]MBF1441799.1 hypothetical protein [Hoylesella nanceiensis]UZG50656.1 hypothetical protein OKW85_08180 [Veillonella rogosae]